MLLAPARRLLLTAILVAAPLSLIGNAAKAQGVDLSTDEVSVDLSVIEGPGTSPAAAPYMARPQGLASRQGLLLPGSKNPVSQLHVAVPKGTGTIKLKRPGSKVKKTTRRVARKKPPVRKPEIKKPEPPKVAATKPPEPLTSAPPAPPAEAKPVVEAEPKPAPKPAKREEAKVAPQAPPPMKKPAVTQPVPPKAAPPAIPAAPATPVAAAEPKPKSGEKEQATASPPPKETPTGPALRVAFGATASKLPASAKDGLKALAEKMKGKDNLRLQLLSYAGGKSLSPSKARRMSLSRALSVRSFLIENGVRSTRIDVRALGAKTTEKPLNRVDVNIVER